MTSVGTTPSPGANTNGLEIPGVSEESSFGISFGVFDVFTTTSISGFFGISLLGNFYFVGG